MNVDFNHKTILITGGAGFIGSNLAFYLQNEFPESKLVIFDVFQGEENYQRLKIKNFGNYKNLIGFKGKIISGDITNQEDLQRLKVYQFDYIFHFAAISDTRVTHEEIMRKTNVTSFYDLLAMAHKNNTAIIYASSASTYGSSPSPQKIGDEAPDNLYGASKHAMDQIADKYIQEYPEMHIVGLKFFNVYGEREYFKEKTASMILQLGHQILAGKSPRLFENSNKIMRDFVYIKDVITANILACSAKKSGIYNIGTGIRRSFKDIVDILQKELDTNLSIEYFENPYKAYQTDTQADISLSEEFLNYSPKYTLEQGIQEYIPYIQQTFNRN